MATPTLNTLNTLNGVCKLLILLDFIIQGVFVDPECTLNAP